MRQNGRRDGRYSCRHRTLSPSTGVVRRTSCLRRNRRLNHQGTHRLTQKASPSATSPFASDSSRLSTLRYRDSTQALSTPKPTRSVFALRVRAAAEARWPASLQTKRGAFAPQQSAGPCATEDGGRTAAVPETGSRTTGSSLIRGTALQRLPSFVATDPMTPFWWIPVSDGRSRPNACRAEAP